MLLPLQKKTIHSSILWLKHMSYRQESMAVPFSNFCQFGIWVCTVYLCACTCVYLHVCVCDKPSYRYDTRSTEGRGTRTKLFLCVSRADDEGHCGKWIPWVRNSRGGDVWHKAWYDSQHTCSRPDGDTWHWTTGITGVSVMLHNPHFYHCWLLWLLITGIVCYKSFLWI